ncbi:MAG: hypothetical protein NTV23_12875 [Propionibacteriales bacterium]|nr:hypothetical protein [Propionibacteriales bacterium]
MSAREVDRPMMVLAVLCAIPVLGGVALLLAGGSQALGFALVGFFGSGVWVLGRKALEARHR